MACAGSRERLGAFLDSRLPMLPLTEVGVLLRLPLALALPWVLRLDDDAFLTSLPVVAGTETTFTFTRASALLALLAVIGVGVLDLCVLGTMFRPGGDDTNCAGVDCRRFP